VKKTNHYIELDMRKELAHNLEPFDKVMDAIEQLDGREMFILHVSFNPHSLHKVMKRRGFTYHVEQIEQNYWKVMYKKSR